MGAILTSGDLHVGHSDLGPYILVDPTGANNNTINTAINTGLGQDNPFLIGTYCFHWNTLKKLTLTYKTHKVSHCDLIHE